MSSTVSSTQIPSHEKVLPSVSAPSVSEPRDKSDHVASLKWCYDRFLAGDLPALRPYLIDQVQFLEPSHENNPRPKPSDIPWVRGSSNFDDFVKNSELMMADIDLNVQMLDFFTSTNPSNVVVEIECKVVGKATGKSVVFKALHQWTFNEQHLIVKWIGYYDPIVWKQIL